MALRGRGAVSVQGAPISGAGYVWMPFGVLVSILVGFALMALVFYSSRHGDDEREGHSVDEDLRRAPAHRARIRSQRRILVFHRSRRLAANASRVSDLHLA